MANTNALINRPKFVNCSIRISTGTMRLSAIQEELHKQGNCTSVASAIWPVCLCNYSQITRMKKHVIAY